MKKMLIMAMAVFALMACKNSSDTGLPKDEAKALEEVTVGAIDQLGGTPDQVDAALTDAGFIKLNGGFIPPISAPEKVTPKKMKSTVAASQKQVIYAYGIPDNYNTMTEAQAMAWLNNALADGKSLMLVYTMFIDDELTVMQTMFVVKKSSDANKTFTAISDDLYAELPSGQQNYYWMGEIDDHSEKEGEQTYSDHSAFVAAVAKAEGINVQEYGAAVYKGWAYSNTWVNPTKYEEEEMMKEGLSVAVCVGMYMVTNNFEGGDF